MGLLYVLDEGDTPVVVVVTDVLMDVSCFSSRTDGCVDEDFGGSVVDVFSLIGTDLTSAEAGACFFSEVIELCD